MLLAQALFVLGELRPKPIRRTHLRPGRLLIALACLMMASSGCARTLQARVLDAGTRQPVEGAVVVGVWTKIEGFVLYHHRFVGLAESEP